VEALDWASLRRSTVVDIASVRIGILSSKSPRDTRAPVYFRKFGIYRWKCFSKSCQIEPHHLIRNGNSRKVNRSQVLSENGHFSHLAKLQ